MQSYKRVIVRTYKLGEASDKTSKWVFSISAKILMNQKTILVILL